MIGGPLSATLSARDRRALTWGAVVVVGALGLGRGWPAYTRWSSALRTTAQAEAGDAFLAQRDAVHRRTLRNSVVARDARVRGYERRLVHASSATAAAAELGSIVRDVADDAGVTVGPVAVEVDSSDTSAAPYLTVRASAEVTGLFGAVTDMLGDLEIGPYALRVREFAADPVAPATVWAPPGAAGPVAGTAATGDAATTLHVRLVVEGLAQAAQRR